MRPALRPMARQRGVTLMELIIVIVVMSYLALVGSTMIADSFLTSKMVATGQSTQNQARYAVERLAREIRQIKYTPGNPGTYAITSVTSPAPPMSFTNVVKDENQADVDQAVTVDVLNGNLRLSYGTAQVLCSNVSAFTVNYLKLDNSAATSTANVRFVVVSLTVRDATSGQAVTERIRVALRSS